MLLLHQLPKKFQVRFPCMESLSLVIQVPAQKESLMQYFSVFVVPVFLVLEYLSQVIAPGLGCSLLQSPRSCIFLPNQVRMKMLSWSTPSRHMEPESFQSSYAHYWCAQFKDQSTISLLIPFISSKTLGHQL